ncbi:MAG: DMT family transporter [Actinomycetales bacterium]|nr:MAG: DMT family transporter [Actinomycetales bacterium]
MNAFLAMVAVLGVSASGPLMAGTHAPALAIAFWRNAAATVVLAPVAGVRCRDEYRALDRRHLVLTVLAGVMLAAHFATWVSSLKLTTVAAATALVTTQLLWVVAFDAVRGVGVQRSVVVGSLLSVVGVLVVSGVDVSVSWRAAAGDVLAVAGGAFAAAYLLMGQQVRGVLSTTAYTTACYGTCSVVLLVVCVAGGVDLGGYAARDWLLIAAVTVCAQLLGHSLLNHLLAVMSPLVISLLLLLEVPGAALLAGVWLGQTPAWGVYVGLGLILAGLAVVQGTRADSTGQYSLLPGPPV